MFLRAFGKRQQWKWVMKGSDDEKGPNNASGIVWAISKIYYYYYFVLN